MRGTLNSMTTENNVAPEVSDLDVLNYWFESLSSSHLDLLRNLLADQVVGFNDFIQVSLVPFCQSLDFILYLIPSPSLSLSLSRM